MFPIERLDSQVWSIAEPGLATPVTLDVQSERSRRSTSEVIAFSQRNTSLVGFTLTDQLLVNLAGVLIGGLSVR